MSADELMQDRSQTIDVGAWRRLCASILFRGGIARRAKGDGILALAGFKVTGDAKVDQVEMSLGCNHDVGRFEVTEDNWWLMIMQIIQYIAEDDTQFKYLIEREE